MRTVMMMLTLFGFVVVGKSQPVPTRDTISADAATVVQRFFHAYRSKDHAKVTSLLHPDVIWVQPGANRISGVKVSREQVLQMGEQMSELSAKTLSLADIKILNATNNTVACVVRWKAAQPTGATLDIMNVDVYTIENGMIVNVRVYSENLALEDKFWGR